MGHSGIALPPRRAGARAAVGRRFQREPFRVTRVTCTSGEDHHHGAWQLSACRKVAKSVREALELVGAERKEMSVFTNLRRRTAADTTVAGDSRLDAWARARGAALVESIVRATHPGA